MKKTALLFAASLLLFLGGSSWAGRPLTVDDAGIIAAKQIQTEWGVSLAKAPEGGKSWACPPTLSVGFYDRVQLGLGCVWSREESEGADPLSGWGDLGAFAKIHWLGEKNGLPALATTFSLTFPTASQEKGLSTGKSDFDALLILTKGFGPLSASLNGGYLVVGKPEGISLRNVFHGGGAFEWPFSKKASLVGEAFGASSPDSGGPTEWQANLGLRFFPTPWAMLDCALGRGLRDTDPDFTATAGITFTFPVKAEEK
jgi:hypothetical protein